MDNREWLSDFIATKDEDSVARLVGLVLDELYSRQTEAEKAAAVTKVDNAIGFTAFDAKSGTADAEAFRRYGRLSSRRVERWTRKSKKGVPRICKYHAQINKEELESKLSSSIPAPKNALDEARQEYARVRGLFWAGSDIEHKEFDSMVRNKVGANATPEQYVATAKSMRVKCKRCAGTGQFITMVVNNKPTGPGGICFRCEGKGFQTEADARRNWGYDRFGRKL